MYLVVDGLAYNQAQYNSLNCQWSILYHLCCSYVVPHVVCIYAILRIIDIYVETLFFSRVPTVNIAQKNFGNILWKHFKIFSFAGVRWGSHEACVKFFTVNEKYISRIWPIFLHAPHNPRQRLRCVGHRQTLFSTSSICKLYLLETRYYLHCITSGGHVRDVRGPGDDQQVADSQGQPRKVHPAGQARIQVVVA